MKRIKTKTNYKFLKEHIVSLFLREVPTLKKTDSLQHKGTF